MSDTSPTRILNSWKEISQYLGRGVRTAQRWETLFGMPVRRPAGRDRSAVLAFSEEIDAWLKNMRTRPESSRAGTDLPAKRPDGSRVGQAYERSQLLHARTRTLVSHMQELQGQLERSLLLERELRSRLAQNSRIRNSLQSSLTPLLPARREKDAGFVLPKAG